MKYNLQLPALLSAMLLLTACGGSSSDGASNAVSIDTDNDGLIEISSLEQLNWIRNNLSGTSLNNGTDDSNEGCSAQIGCIGYELTQDLDFDTNGDGVMDANDTYYDYDGDSSNSGWLPIGTSSTSPFTAIFDGNGFEIRNLFINRPNGDVETNGAYIGLFGYIQGGSDDAEIRNIGLTGDLMSVTGDYRTGGLAGYAQTAVISTSYSTGTILGETRTGGLIGETVSSAISASYVTGSVTGTGSDVGNYVGGLVSVTTSTDILACYVTGALDGHENSDVNGLVGYVYQSSVKSSHWATDTTNQSSGYRLYGSQVDKNFGATLNELECPTAANDTSCKSGSTISGSTLYDGWDAIDHDGDANTDDISPWVFGDTNTLPTL